MATMMLGNTSGNFRASRRFACDRCRSFKLRCQRDESLGDPCERCAKARLTCTTTFEHTSQRLSLPSNPNRLSHPHQQHPQQRDDAEQEGRSEPRAVAVIEARPSPPPEAQERTTQRRESHSRFDSDPPRPQLPSPPSLSPNQLSDPLHSPSRQQPTAVSKTATALPSETNGLTRHATDTADCMLLDQNNTLSLDMDFAMSDIAFDPTDYDLALLIGGHHPSPRNETGVDSRHRRGGSDRVSNIFGHRDDFNGTNGDMLGWPSHNGGGLSDAPQTSTVEPARKHDPAPHIPNTNGESRQHVLQAPGCYIDLLKLSLELVEDQYIIETQAPLDGTPTPPPHECPPAEQSRFINRVLNQSSRFWDILKTMSLEAESQRQRTTSAAKSNGESNGFHNGNGHTNGGSNGGSLDSGAWRGWTRPRTGDTNNSNGNRVDMDLYGTSSSSSSSSSPPVASHRVDPVLVVNLVMTYVYLLRSCRAVFVRLYQALEMTPTAESRSPLRLPSLQFGDFQLENNLAIQVKVLVEMMSGMLLRIGNTLGISPSGVIVPADGNASPPAEDRDCRLPFMSDPVAVSVREIILSQERAQGGGITRPGEAPPLPEIMANLRRLLGRRYSVV